LPQQQAAALEVTAAEIAGAMSAATDLMEGR